jgi:hypothetical protein
VNKAIGARRPDRLFVQTLGVELAALNTRKLGPDQRGSILEIFGAMLRPRVDLMGANRP